LEKTEERQIFAAANPCVKEWLERVAPYTARDYLSTFYRFMAWMKTNGGDLADKTPEELLNIQDKAIGRERYRIVRLAQRFVEDGDASHATKSMRYTAIKSFFQHNLVELPRDPTYRIKGDYATVPTGLEVEELRKILLGSSRLYRAVFLTMFQGAMGESELEYFSNNLWSQLEPQMRSELPAKLDFPGRKHARNQRGFYTFIGRDAKQALKEYFEKDRGTIRKDEPIFLNDLGKPLSRENVKVMFNRVAMKVDLITVPGRSCPKCGGNLKKILKRVNGPQLRFYHCLNCGEDVENTPDLHLAGGRVRYRMHAHELRDCFRTEFGKTGARPEVAEFMMGHDIDKNHYDKFYKDLEYTRDEYEKAEPYLNLLSQDPRVVSRSSVDDLERKIRALEEENLAVKRRLDHFMNAVDLSDDETREISEIIGRYLLSKREKDFLSSRAEEDSSQIR
jgi:hypothetical protein